MIAWVGIKLTFHLIERHVYCKDPSPGEMESCYAGIIRNILYILDRNSHKALLVGHKNSGISPRSRFSFSI